MASDNLRIKYTATENGVKAVWTRRIEDWSDVSAKVDEAYGADVNVAGNSWRIGVSTLPGRDWMVLKSVDIDFWDDKPGADDDDGLPTCDVGAKLVMTFETLQYEIIAVGEGETFLTHTVDSTVNMMTLPSGQLKWESDNGRIPRDLVPGFPVVMVQHQFQWHNIFDPPLANLYEYGGKINSTAFLGHAIGTVLFNKIGATYTMTTNQKKRYTLTLGCTARLIKGEAYDGQPITWNHFLRSDAGEGLNPWEEILYRSDAAPQTRVLPRAELNNLLTLFGYTHPVSLETSPP
jgi:hypothetical protein